MWNKWQKNRCVCIYINFKSKHGTSKIKQQQHVVQDCVKLSNFLILLPFRRYAIYLLRLYSSSNRIYFFTHYSITFKGDLLEHSSSWWVFDHHYLHNNHYSQHLWSTYYVVSRQRIFSLSPWHPFTFVLNHIHFSFRLPPLLFLKNSKLFYRLPQATSNKISYWKSLCCIWYPERKGKL